MLDSRAFGARMTGLSLGLDSRLCGNDGMGSFGGCVLATGCEQGGAKNQAQEGYCRLPIAILRQRRLRSSYFGWFVSCLFLCVMPMASATDKSHYT